MCNASVNYPKIFLFSNEKWKTFFCLTKSRRSPIWNIFRGKTSIVPPFFYCKFACLNEFYITFIIYRKSCIVWNLPPWNHASVSYVLKWAVTSKWVKMWYFFIGEKLTLGSGWSHVKRLWACEHGNPPKIGCMYVLLAFIASLCQNFEGVFLSFLFFQNQVH